MSRFKPPTGMHFGWGFSKARLFQKGSFNACMYHDVISEYIYNPVCWIVYIA